jgi:hypothetical protein
MKKIKIIISAIVTFILIWISQFMVGVSLPPENVYLNDSWLFFYPPLIIVIFSFLFSKFKKKEGVTGVIIGGLIYYLGLVFIYFFPLGQVICGRYFFNLLTNCP